MAAPRRSLFRVDAFRLALYVGLVLTGLHVLDVLWARKGSQLPVVSRIEHAVQDYTLTTLRGPRVPSGDVLIVAIDERSIEVEGLWPWGRARVALLVQKLAEAGVKGAAFDMIWGDDDVQGARLAEVARRVKAARSLATGDDAARLDRIWEASKGSDPTVPPDVDPTTLLADAIEQAKNVTIGFLFRSDVTSPEVARRAVERLVFYRTGPLQVLGPGGHILADPSGGHRSAGRTFPSVLPPVEDLVKVSDSGGYFTVLPDSDGVIRRYLLVASTGGSVFPSLGVALVARARGRDGLPAPVVPIGVAGSSVLVGTLIGDLVIPTDDYGRAPLSYYGPFRDFPSVSAIDVMTGRVGAERLRGKLVVVGATAPGTNDQRLTPFDENAPGVITHATFVDNVLHGQLLDRSQWVVLGEVIAMALASLLLAWLFSRVGPVAAAPALLAVTAIWAAVAVLALRRFNLVLAMGLPLIQVFGMFLTATTYRFFSEERAKRKARESFSRFLAPAIVDEVLGREGSLQLGGEKRELTALFADIRGFTTISERLDPHRLLELLNQYLTPMTEIIVSRHQGTLDKYMGDAIMAFWGAPKAQPDHALRSCRAALDMLEDLERLRAGWRLASLPDIDIGIGLNTGPMSVGFVGSQDRFYNYTILGDAVNLASRLEGANKLYGTRIIIGQNTYDLVREQVVARQLDLVRVKGKLEPVRIYELMGLAPASADDAAFLEAFGWGYGAWRAQRWDEAMVHFSEADRLRGGDDCAQLYLERCEQMRREPPGPDWDGAFTMESK
jgi:adenylate cyclase